MKSVLSFMKKQSQLHLTLITLIVLFIVTDINVPAPLASMIDTTIGNLVIIVFALGLLVNEKPIVGVLGVIAAYELIKRSSVKTGTFAVRRYLPSE